MTTVCPALLPPWYLTTKSTLSPSRSVALPLPSSPHCAPASTMAGIRRSLPCSGGAAVPGVAGQHRRGLAAAVGQELLAAPRLVILADGRGGPAEQKERPQETAIGLVLPRNRALPAPARAAQQIEAPVIAGAREGVR